PLCGASARADHRQSPRQRHPRRTSPPERRCRHRPLAGRGERLGQSESRDVIMSTEARLRELGIDLPDIPPPIADGYVPKFAPWIRSGDHIFLSGRLAKTGDQLLVGKVGADIALDAARSAARDVAIELLGVLKAAVGDLDHVSQVARMLVMVNGAPGFNEPHRIADGASELLV